MKNKQIIRLTESDLHNMIAEAVKYALRENDELDISNTFTNLRKQSKTYHPNDSNPNIIDKTFNRGMGKLEFIQIIPDENVLLVNKLLVKKKDLERITQAFPEYTIELVELGYPDYYRKGLSSMRTKTK